MDCTANILALRAVRNGTDTQPQRRGAIQLKCWYTGRPAQEPDRIRIQGRIDALEAQLKAETNPTEQSNLIWRIGVLAGTYRPHRG